MHAHTHVHKYILYDMVEEEIEGRLYKRVLNFLHAFSPLLNPAVISFQGHTGDVRMYSKLSSTSYYIVHKPWGIHDNSVETNSILVPYCIFIPPPPPPHTHTHTWTVLSLKNFPCFVIDTMLSLFQVLVTMAPPSPLLAVQEETPPLSLVSAF